MNGKLFLIVGPSGVGKGTVIEHLKKRFPNFVFPLSYTTREKRPQEKDGEVYHFISKQEFEQGIKDGKFLEFAHVHGENYYGTLKAPIVTALENGKNVIREVDIQGFQSIKTHIPSGHLVSIFLFVPTWDTLIARIQKRHLESDEELAHRKSSFEHEMSLRHLCDYQVESREGEIEKCVAEVERIIKDLRFRI